MVISPARTSFSRFYDSNIFRATALITRWDDKVIRIQMHPKNEEKTAIMKEATQRHISSVVVCEGDKPIGYSVVSRWCKRADDINVINFRKEHHINP